VNTKRGGEIYTGHGEKNFTTMGAEEILGGKREKKN